MPVHARAGTPTLALPARGRGQRAGRSTRFGALVGGSSMSRIGGESQRACRLMEIAEKRPLRLPRATAVVSSDSAWRIRPTQGGCVRYSWSLSKRLYPARCPDADRRRGQFPAAATGARAVHGVLRAQRIDQRSGAGIENSKGHDATPLALEDRAWCPQPRSPLDGVRLTYLRPEGCTAKATVTFR